MIRSDRFSKKMYTLLIVDDDDQLRVILENELLDIGYDVSSASDGNEGLEFIQKKKFDLLILDIKMPGINGFQLLRYSKEKHIHTKVIMLTGFADLHHAIESKRLGADDFLGKPYDLTDLESTIQRSLCN